MACYIAIASWWIAYRMIADFLEKGFIMKTKKIDRIGFSLPSGITFWFANTSDGIKAMIDLLNRYDDMNNGKIFDGNKPSYQ